MNNTPKITYADLEYFLILEKLLETEPIPSRNNPARKMKMGCEIRFDSCPYVTVRKIAPKKAVRELQWFLESDSDECPEDLRDWWDGQLNPDGKYLHGYRANLQGQLEYVINGLKTNPQSRRLVMSAWDAETAPQITELNQNPKTPTPCHLVYVQFDVNAIGKLDMLVVQRSGDILLGVPHNWIQHWYLLQHVAEQTGITRGQYIWYGCNIHLYDEESHLQCAQEIVNGMSGCDYFNIVRMKNNNWNPEFVFDHLPHEPFSKIKPKLL